MDRKKIVIKVIPTIVIIIFILYWVYLLIQDFTGKFSNDLIGTFLDIFLIFALSYLVFSIWRDDDS